MFRLRLTRRGGCRSRGVPESLRAAMKAQLPCHLPFRIWFFLSPEPFTLLFEQWQQP